MNIKSALVALTVVAGLAIPSAAAAVTVTSIEGTWQNANSRVKGVGTDKIRWGKSTGYGRSGYDFVSAPTNVATSPDTSFVLGSFKHLNFPVYGPFLESVDLVVSFTVEGLNEAITSVFSFEHTETLNGASTCAYGTAGVGVNVNGCADHVTASLNEDKSESFMLGGVEYLLDVTGFLHKGSLMNDFWTVENARNSAELVAEFRVLGTDEPQELPSEVPLPASGLLLLAGVAGLMAKGRRR